MIARGFEPLAIRSGQPLMKKIALTLLKLLGIACLVFLGSL